MVQVLKIVFKKNNSMNLSNPSQVQFSIQQNNHIKENFSLVVLKKVTYSFDESGLCHQRKDSALNIEEECYEKGSELIKKEFDLYPIKNKTDLIVKGSVKGSNNQRILEVGIEVENRSKFSVYAIGNRKAYFDQSNKIVFTEPEIISEIPLSFAYAYGGFDQRAEQDLPPIPPSFIKSFGDINFEYSSVYRYPRNPCGKGYAVINQKGVLEDFNLPNLEDINNLIRPNELIINQYENWINQPIPMATDWVNAAWFPRIVYFGIFPFDRKFNLVKELPETTKRYLTQEILNENFIEGDNYSNAANGAHPGLQFPYLKGNEKIKLTNIHPTKQEFVLQLPGDRPKIWVDGRNGTLKPTTPVIHTIVIEPDEGRLSIVWRGSAPALRPYMDEELKTMPFKVEW
jgi:hypothetical protein